MRVLKNWLLRKEQARIDAYIAEERRVLEQAFNSRMDYLDRKYGLMARDNDRMREVMLQTAALNIKPEPVRVDENLSVLKAWGGQ